MRMFEENTDTHVNVSFGVRREKKKKKKKDEGARTALFKRRYDIYLVAVARMNDSSTIFSFFLNLLLLLSLAFSCAHISLPEKKETKKVEVDDDGDR